MMSDKRRLEQINELLREEIGRILIEENADPLFAALTVTGARVSADLSFARVFVMVSKFGSGLAMEAGSAENLKLVGEKVQRLLAPRIRIKRTPRLRFQVDETEERAARIEELLQEVKEDWQDAERDSKR